jgi:DNA-binding SARP family transcriptional activator
MTGPGSLPFRHAPPELDAHLVTRSRLLTALRGRFDRRLTLVVAGAGFGKTTLLAQAVAENRIVSDGTDHWLALGPSDHRPGRLLAGLASALDAAPDTVHEVETIAELLWLRAPEPVALIIDDAHVLDGSPSWNVVADLLGLLPTNAHLVIGSRTMPPIAIRSLQAVGEVLVLGEDDLAFDDEELHVLAERLAVDTPHLPPGHLPTWPALAVLRAIYGPAASLEYVWEVVLGRLDDDRREALALVVRFERIDDDLVAATVGPNWTADRLVEGLPLVDALGPHRRFHELWQSALAHVVSEERWRNALVDGARLLAERGETVRAARALRTAGREDLLLAVVHRFASSSVVARLDANDAGLLAELLPPGQRYGPLGEYLALVRNGRLGSPAFAMGLRGILQSLEPHDAGDAADDMLRAILYWRLAQFSGDADPVTIIVPAELERLAEHSGPDGVLARAGIALLRSHVAQEHRMVDEALDHVARIRLDDPNAQHTAQHSRLVQLARPELVATTLTEVLADGVSDPVDAHAVWLRGEIDPSIAWPIAAGLPAAYEHRRIPTVQVPLLHVVTTVAIAAGDLRSARTLADTCRSLAAELTPRIQLYGLVADALATLSIEGEDAAREQLCAMLDLVPLGGWPSWAHLSALAALRVLTPEGRVLDELPLGPSLTVAVDAGRALVALREDGAFDPALALPWGNPDLLRVQVPPPFLVELALACADRSPDAEACLERIPEPDRWIRRLAGHRVEQVARRAAAVVAAAPRRPEHQIEIGVLGEFRIRRSDGIPVPDRFRSGRVLQLLAHLVLSGDTTRTRLAAELWPDLTAKQAQANLRVTLASLLDTIEPERDPGGAWFVRSVDGRLALTEDGVDLDLRHFEHHVAAARQAEQNSSPLLALEHHRAAMDVYGGELFPGLDDELVTQERLRLQSLALNSACRLAELTLARGEPETALRHALDAARLDPLAERAHRTAIRAHLALGSRSAATAAARHLRELLAEARLTPERETELLLDAVAP